jgi:hypothetical protein
VGKQAAGRPPVGEHHFGAGAIHPELAAQVVQNQRKETQGPLNGAPYGRAVQQRMAQDRKAAPPHGVGIHAEELVIERIGQGMPQGAVLLG